MSLPLHGRPRPLNDLSFAEFEQFLAPVDPTPTEVRKVFAGIHAHALDHDGLANIRAVRRPVLDYVQTGELARLEVVDRRKALDGFVKYLFRSPRGGEFEAVRIPIFDKKHVVCISSQVGCALACDFCQTGKLGFKRNLATWEMIEQIRIVREEAELPVRGIVFMGMGEPLLNYDNVMRAASIFSNPAGYAIGARTITVSTAGVVPGIRRYIRDEQPYRLAFSVTSAIPEKRLQVMPIERTHSIEELVACIREYALKRRERAMVAYVAISGFNMGREDAEALKAAFEGVPIKLDLIEVTDPTGKWKTPDAEEYARFRDHLQILKSPIVRRYSGGKDIQAACGTLAATRQGGTVLEPAPEPTV